MIIIFTSYQCASMKTIPDTIREVLIASNVLRFNAGGDLIFAGLTQDESQFFLGQLEVQPHLRGQAEELIFHQLQHRYLRARMLACSFSR